MSHILRCVQPTPVSLIGSVPTDGKCILTRQNRPKLKYSNNNFFSSVYATSKHMVPHNYCCLFCIIGSWEQCLNFKPWDCCYWFILAHRCAAYPCWGWRCLHHSSLCAKQNQDQDRWVAKEWEPKVSRNTGLCFSAVVVEPRADPWNIPEPGRPARDDSHRQRSTREDVPAEVVMRFRKNKFFCLLLSRTRTLAQDGLSWLAQRVWVRTPMSAVYMQASLRPTHDPG